MDFQASGHARGSKKCLAEDRALGWVASLQEIFAQRLWVYVAVQEVYTRQLALPIGKVAYSKD
jgi:hypothetical protein